MSEYAERIKEVIDKSVLNQRKVAAMVGVTETALSNWLSGSRGMNADKITSICNAIEPYVGDCRFYVFTGEKPEDHLKAFDVNSRYIARDEVSTRVQEFLLKMNSLKQLVIIGKFDEIMENFALSMQDTQVQSNKKQNGS